MKTDIILQASVFETSRATSFSTYGLDTAHFYTFMLKNFGHELCKLLYEDTDSLFYEIKYIDRYEDIIKKILINMQMVEYWVVLQV